MRQVRSKDGTAISYERQGAGAPVVLVGGGLDDGAENAPLARELAGRFTVDNYARRGRGASGDTLPYAVAREIDDLDALIAEAGEPVRLFGASSGGALALEAAAAGLAIDRVAVYEVPYAVLPEDLRRWREYTGELADALADGERATAVELFMRLAGAGEHIAAARSSPVWPHLERLAPTLAYDAACLGDGRPPAGRLANVGQPVLVVTGGSEDFFERAADAITAGVPHARRLTLSGQGHVADPAALAAVLADFFSG
ncbi:alpha-beta hydrolase superfamily lysophospholipase [Prauserella shujinwangii]|uniref:Alpha-beta hydrolase superfamily lysophospholipase n=1 Tax=Prauserella shujinwangii TaxID=1453103 RepID=A0A2T0LZ87_9PSEU|nr:alpha/beta fold hydrolase [Prauserella shujinwangii]PRX49410.1 alpha-beta hydrolase superfamily lysophospholipase [Prauserella shujinwangii]